MTRKQIDQMREIRLWISQVAVPIAGITAIAIKPEIKDEIAQKVTGTYQKIVSIFKK